MRREPGCNNSANPARPESKGLSANPPILGNVGGLAVADTFACTSPDATDRGVVDCLREYCNNTLFRVILRECAAGCAAKRGTVSCPGSADAGTCRSPWNCPTSNPPRARAAGSSGSIWVSRTWRCCAPGNGCPTRAGWTAWAGARLIVADRWFASSKTCSGCGTATTKLTLSQRTYTCTTCGLVLDRDHNAARNLAALATGTGELRRSSPTEPTSDHPSPLWWQSDRCGKSRPRLNVASARKRLDERSYTFHRTVCANRLADGPAWSVAGPSPWEYSRTCVRY
ncbi:MAG: zinc ribbon domain-containing protein [Pseudonocardiales bacterium]